MHIRIILFLLLLVPYGLYGQHDQLNFISIDVKDGFLKNQALYLFQNSIYNTKSGVGPVLRDDNYFRIQASNISGICTNIKPLTIIINATWWKTIRFNILLMVAFLLFIFAFYRYNTNLLKRHKDLLQKQVAERTKQISAQNVVLNETNTLLEERQQYIEEQSEELITQKDELEKANIHLSELNSMKNKFFSIIAHDLKNPLHSIMGLTELLILNFDKMPDEKKMHFLKMIMSSTNKSYSLLENLLNWARSQTNTLKYDPEMISIREVFEESFEFLLTELERKRITVTGGEIDYEVYADKNMTLTIVRNLLSNAIKFTPEEGCINIVFTPNDKMVEIAVSDTGMGIAEENIEKLFRIDLNIATAGTEGEKGTGLGLILCKEFVEKNKGSILVKSKLNEGTTVTFTLPLSALTPD